MKRVRLSGSAGAYFRQETAYLRKRSRPASEAFRARIAKALQTLASFPRSGFAHDGLHAAGVLRLIIGDYLIDYVERGDQILVLSIRHSRQAPLDDIASDGFDYEAPSDAS